MKFVTEGAPNNYVDIYQILSFCFREDNVILKFENGTDLSTEFFETHGFNRPILVTNKEGLGMVIPDKKFTVMDVERHVGTLVVRKVELFVI